MRSQRLLFAGWVAWACFVISRYYVQLPRLVIAGPTTVSLSGAIGLFLPVLLLGAIIALQRTRRGISHRCATCYTLPPALGRTASIALVTVAVAVVPWLLVWPLLVKSLSTMSLPGLPWFGEAAGRVFVAVTGATLVGAATMATGARVLDALNGRSINRVEYLVFAWTCGVGVISYSSLLLALLGIYRPLTVALLITAALLSAFRQVRRLRAGVLRFPPLPSLRPAAVAWLGLIVVALGYGLVAAIAPEKEYDAVWSRFYLPRTWLAAGRPVDIVHEFVSLYPLTWELLFAAGGTLGGIVGAKLLHFACLPLLGLLVWQTTRRFFPHASGIAAAALVITTPTVLWESSTAYVDLALALHATAGCYALARYAEENERAWGAIAALQLGLAAATKHLGLIVTGIALALYVIWVLQSVGGVKLALRRALLIGALALAVPSPWYARSWIAIGKSGVPGDVRGIWRRAAGAVGRDQRTGARPVQGAIRQGAFTGRCPRTPLGRHRPRRLIWRFARSSVSGADSWDCLRDRARLGEQLAPCSSVGVRRARSLRWRVGLADQQLSVALPCPHRPSARAARRDIVGHPGTRRRQPDAARLRRAARTYPDPCSHEPATVHAPARDGSRGLERVPDARARAAPRSGSWPAGNRNARILLRDPVLRGLAVDQRTRACRRAHPHHHWR